MLLVHLTDPHMRAAGEVNDAGVAPGPAIEKTVAAVNALARRPDAVLVTGDLVDDGDPAQYAALKPLLDPLSAPYFVLPGNHDARAALREAFADHAYLPSAGPLNWVADRFPVRLIGIDAILPGVTEGAVAAETLDWLADRLAEDRRPTILAIHHPPFPTGSAEMDGICCQNGDALAAVVAGAPHVARVLCGHLHQPIQARWAGTLALVGAAAIPQKTFDPLTEVYGAGGLRPAGFGLHLCQSEGAVASYQITVD